MAGNKNSGFASMDPQKQREIAAKGGRSGRVGKGFAKNPALAVEAGRKGGRNSHSKRSQKN